MLIQHQQKSNYLFALAAFLVALSAGYLIGIVGLPAVVAIILVPIFIAIIWSVLANPRVGLFLYFQLAFLVPFIGHFVPLSLPIGVSVEAVLILTMLSLFLNSKKMHWHRLKNIAFYILLIWIGYTILEFFNPESPNRVPAWLYRFRSISFHWLCAAIIVSVVTITRRDIKILLVSWVSWSSIAALWAFKQQYIGLTASEQRWLNTVGAKTHLLFGHLRSFSFYSDAAQLGAEMASVALVCLILVFECKRLWQRVFFSSLTIFFFWGYAVTGTRSALFVLIAGFLFYLVLKRDILKIVIGGVSALMPVFILMFTSIGNGNYQMYRMRTALHPDEDPSYKLRKSNQLLLAEYLKPFPFGAGLGTTMSPGDIYSPDHWAALIAPDTWYVVIWIETGRVGVTLYVLMILSFIAIGSYEVFYLKEGSLRTMCIILLAQFVGIATMAYANTIMGQFPTSTLLFIGSFIFTTCDRWDTQEKKKDSANSNSSLSPDYISVA